MEAATAALDVRKEALETIVTLLEQPPFGLLHFEADSFDTVALRHAAGGCACVYKDSDSLSLTFLGRRDRMQLSSTLFFAFTVARFNRER